MTHRSESYPCEHCGKPDYSSVGDPRYSFHKSSLDVLLVCKDCLEQLEKEKEEQDRIDNELNEAA